MLDAILTLIWPTRPERRPCSVQAVTLNRQHLAIYAIFNISFHLIGQLRSFVTMSSLFAKLYVAGVTAYTL